MKRKIAICMPCYGRPERTKRAIECILAQTVNNWEAFIIGDACPQFEQLMKENNRALGDNSWEARAEQGGNKIWMFNAQTHGGGWGYAIRNYVNHYNNAEYLLYLDNDDTIEPGHFYHRLQGIDRPYPADFVYFNTKCVFANFTRNASLVNGMIGHAELVIRSQFLKDHPEIQQTMEYGHDWKFIEQMINAGAVYEKANTPYLTYNIMGAGELREKGID
jgi:glycosyltransferase involved in cell wall biosynthesis